jgi:hypothetical protein
MGLSLSKGPRQLHAIYRAWHDDIAHHKIKILLGNSLKRGCALVTVRT